MLSTDAFNEISAVLKDLERATRAELTVFCDANGVPITHVGKISHLDLAAFSSLNAANFAATREMARMVGEKSPFKFLFLEGESNNIYLCNIGYQFLLAIVFSKSVAFGMVRIYANKAVKMLKSILNEAKQTEDELAKQIIDSEFSVLLGKALESSFGPSK